MTNTNNTSNNGAISVIDTNNQAAARNNQTAGLAVKTRVKIRTNSSNRLTGRLLAAVTILGLSVASADRAHAQPTTHRPITDFTGVQVRNIGLSTPSTCIPPQCAGRLASIDYAGWNNQYLVNNSYPSLGTTVNGTITERPLPDGRAEVTVVLHTTNALTWVSTWDPTDPSDNIPPFPTNPLLFGFRPNDILADRVHRLPALAESHLVVTLKNTAPGAPLPDLVNWLVLGNAAPGQELVSFYLDGNATGPLHALAGLGPDGTPGRCIVSEIGVLFRGPFKGATADGFPVERVELHAIGR